MRIIKSISEDEMIAIFLKAEIESERFGHHILQQLQADGVDREIIDSPDSTNTRENTYRRRLLDGYRAYAQRAGYFEGFPHQVEWARAVLSQAEVKQIRYIDYDYWIELSGGTRYAADAIPRIQAGIEIFGQSTQGFWKFVHALEQGKQFDELILVSTGHDDPLVVMEGHARLTAYLMKPDALPEELEVIIGYSPDFVSWGCY